jgi:hypothetical protein
VTDGLTYVYGVVVAAARVHLPESHLGDVRLIEADGLAAVVSDVAEQPQGRRRELKAHADVLAGLCNETTVVPFTFGTVVAGEDAVRRLLGAHEGHFDRELRRLRGLQQFNLTVEPVEEQLLADVMAGSADLRKVQKQVRTRGGQGRQLRFGEMVAHRYRATAESLGAAVVDALRPHLTDVRVEHRQDAATYGALLVRRDDVPALLRAAEDVARQVHGRASCRLTGPMPAFGFVAPLPRTGDPEPAWA